MVGSSIRWRPVCTSPLVLTGTLNASRTPLLAFRARQPPLLHARSPEPDSEDDVPVTVVSWNIGKRHEPWRQLVGMDADVALLQEATSPPPDVARGVDTGPPEHWDSHI